MNDQPTNISPEAALTRTTHLSRFSARLLDAEPDLWEANKLDQPFTAAEMNSQLAHADVSDEAALSKMLRNLRKRVMLRLIARDLNGLADLAEVMATATALAEISIRFALDHLHAWLSAQHGTPIGEESGAAQELIVVGMGKLGGTDLNVSSDIDLIFIYPEEGETNAARSVSNHEYFSRLGRKLIAAVQERTAEGYVFRVDMRLRPYGDSGPLVASFAMLEEYLVTQGREWERYAWIKGRALSGNKIDELEQIVRPFIYRKYLDFGAFASMRDLHAQIRREVARKEMADNIKLGPGGIREIEFIAQVFQLIRGGKLPELQIRPTLAVLERLAAHNFLSVQVIDELRTAYVFLRNLEHRLQYLDDQQTQTLPSNEPDCALIAEGMGFTDYAAFLESLNLQRRRVTRHFEQVFAAPQSEQQNHPLSPLWQGSLGDPEATSTLTELGYRDAQTVWQWLQQAHTGSRYLQLPQTVRARFDALLPPLIEVAAGLSNPDETLERILHLLDNIGRRESYLALMVEYPQTLDQVARLCSASPWAADYLAQHPILLDELLDTRELHEVPDWPRYATELRKMLDEQAGDTERQMDTLRHFKHARTFHLLAQDLAGLLPLETLSDHLSALADLILAEVLRLAWQGLRRKHCDEPRFSVIGYGKLGGKELGYASDLDIIFLYDDPADEAMENYARLAQRINTSITSLTSAGMLYETDLRLRPDGAAGLLVSSIEAFEDYQKNKAWLWEHQALTRARWVAGSAMIGEAFERIRCEVLQQPRDLAKLKDEVLAMRQKILDAHSNPSGLFDIKHDHGGIIDVEFMVQYLVLAHAHQHVELTRNSGNLALLKAAAELSLITGDLAQQVREAYRQYRRWQHALRLQGAQYTRVAPDEAAPFIAPVNELWNSLFASE